MDKNRKHHREKTIPIEDLADVTPPGASFSTEEGRAAQGMRPDIGGDETEKKEKQSPEPAPSDDGASRVSGD